MDTLQEIKRIKKNIKKSKSVFIMAHKNLDLDALSSCLAMYQIVKYFNKECYIINNDKTPELGVEKVLKEIEGCYNIISSNNINEKILKRKNKNLIIILDTNKRELVQDSDILEKIPRTIIIDHHEIGKNTIPSTINIINPKISSTAELIVKLIETYKVELTPYLATLLLSGMTIDTNNFILNTSENTFYTAYYLTINGANNKKVQYLLKQDINSYTERQKLLANITIIDGKIAIAKGTPHAIYRREDLARIADTLLFFNNIDISIVIGKISNDIIGISARSIETNIEPLMESLNGGGNEHNGATTFENKKISEVFDLVKKALKKETK